MRPKWVDALKGTISNYRTAVENPGDKYSHIAQDKLDLITSECGKAARWVADMLAKQATKAKHQTPALTCAMIERKNKQLAEMANKILADPRSDLR